LFTDEDKDEMMKSLTEEKKNVYLQRYKGLGEMNPEQLAETTMNPESRILRQCNIEDTVLADQVFSMLMGEEVEPRRRFIETNAYKVMDTLDV
jgi:DNA gyrase subunit B